MPAVALAFFAYCGITKIMSGLESIGKLIEAVKDILYTLHARTLKNGRIPAYQLRNILFQISQMEEFISNAIEKN
jgi:hypothetical protein